jgi:hypothetical protein
VNVHRTTPYRVTHIECNPYHSICLDWFITLGGTATRRRLARFTFGLLTFMARWM